MPLKGTNRLPVLLFGHRSSRAGLYRRRPALSSSLLLQRAMKDMHPDVVSHDHEIARILSEPRNTRHQTFTNKSLPLPIGRFLVYRIHAKIQITIHARLNK